MPLTERLALLVSLDANGAINGFNKLGAAADKNLRGAEQRIDRVASGMQKAGVGMLGAATLAATGLYKAGQSAADLEQAVGGTKAVFGDVSSTIEKFAKDAASDMGLSERAFREATTSLGGQLKGLGFDVDDAADRSVELTRVAADLAATYGGTTAEAVQALGAAFRGEADPAERFNLFLNQTRVNAKAVELGLAESTSQVDANAKAQATLALITEQSADAQGQFAREAGTAAGQMQIATAEWENAKASLGESIAPVMADIAGGLADLTSGFSAANEESGGLLGKLAAVGTIGLGAAGGISFVAGKLLTMRENLSGLTGPLSGLTGPLRTSEGGFNKLGKAMGALGIAGTIAGLAAMANETTELTVDTDLLASKLDNLTAATERELLGALGAAQQTGQLDEMFRKTADSSVLAAERLLEFAEANGLSEEEARGLKAIIDEKRESDVQGAKDQAEYSSQVSAAVGPTGELAGALDEEAEAAKRTEDALNGLLEATLAQFDSNLGYRQSIDSVEESLAALKYVQAEHGADSEEYRDALLDAEGALLDQADAAVRLAEDQAKANGETLTAEEKARLYKDELVRLAESLSPTSPLRKQLNEYIWQLATVPDQVPTVFAADTAAAAKRVEDLKNNIALIPRSVWVKINVDQSAAVSGEGFLGGKQLIPEGATGGYVTAAGIDPIYRAMGGPSGTDTVNAWLSPGEFVMKRSAVDRIGVGVLAALNAGAGAGQATGPNSGTVVEQTNHFYNPAPEPVSKSARALRRVALDVGG